MGQNSTICVPHPWSQHEHPQQGPCPLAREETWQAEGVVGWGTHPYCLSFIVRVIKQ